MDDLIDRQAAVDTLDSGAELLRRVLDITDIVGAEREKYKWGLELIESCISDMKALPSAEPKKGKWIQTDAKDCRRRTSLAYLYKCSRCGYEDWFDSNFCPSCGADMRGEENE